ncbi:MAG: hypothetical protein ACQEQ0_10195 [Bacteroidota bacterium]
MKPLSLLVIVILFPLVAYTQEPEASTLLKPDNLNHSISNFASDGVKQLKLEFPSPEAPQQKTNDLLKKYSNDHSYKSEETPISAKFKLKNSRTEQFFPHLGSSYHIKSLVEYHPNQQFQFSAGWGLIRIHTALSPNAVMKYSLNSQVRYSFSQWLKLRLYYQSVQNIQGQSANPLIHMNPLFPQSEYGAEISAKIKNVKLDVGPRSIINTENNSLQNLNMINSSISVGF